MINAPSELYFYYPCNQITTWIKADVLHNYLNIHEDFNEWFTNLCKEYSLEDRVHYDFNGETSSEYPSHLLHMNVAIFVALIQKSFVGQIMYKVLNRYEENEPVNMMKRIMY